MPPITRKPFTQKKYFSERTGKPISPNKGGKRRGAGRPPGSKNKAAQDLEQYIGNVMNHSGPDGGLPTKSIEIFQALYKDPKVPPHIRREAAARCLAYEAPKIAPTDYMDPNNVPEQSRISSAKEKLKGKLLALPSAAPSGEMDKQSYG